MPEHAIKTVGRSSGCLDDNDMIDSNGIADFSNFTLKPDHLQRPCWTCPDGNIYLEAFHDIYNLAYDFLVAISEPVARPEFIHQYRLTSTSLYAAVSTNIEPESIIQVLDRLSKNALPTQVQQFVRDCTSKFGKAKLVLKRNKFYVESEFPEVLRELLRDQEIAEARIQEDAEYTNPHGFLRDTKQEEMQENLQMLRESVDGSDNEIEQNERSQKPKVVVSFLVDGDKVENVKRRAIELGYPLMEEYDFRNDNVNPDVPLFDLKPVTRIRRYQERSLAKMFGNGRARSGIVVLPCGAGKTLTGVTAAQTIKKSCVCLATNTVSVHQWKEQFQKWTNIPSERICVFTGDDKEELHPEACVLVTTYTMISYSGKRSEKSKRIMDQITGREWGLMLLDEVHVAPAKTFRKVVGKVKAHCRLGLTVTLVREDDLISDLHFLVGPKLYEANWMDLTSQGYLANVQCVEIRCPMTGSFMNQYFAASNTRLKELLFVMNPVKLRAVQYLVRYHEARGDKILIFSDLVFSLKLYAEILLRPVIYGETPEWERQVVLDLFRTNNKVNTICISKVGDTSIDLPGANVVIQVSSQFASQRKEAQRLGRILRPKSFTPRDGTNKSFYNAFFYTLVSTDTKDTFYSDRRQRYLVNQGYSYKVVTSLCETADREAIEKNYSYSTPEKVSELLHKVLESGPELEKAERAEDAAIRKNDGGGIGSANAGAKGEAAASHTDGGRRQRKGAAAGKHFLFRKRQKR